MTEYEKAMISETRKSRKALQSIARSLDIAKDLDEIIEDVNQQIR